jgi:hypothetical protein
MFWLAGVETRCCLVGEHNLFYGWFRVRWRCDGDAVTLHDDVWVYTCVYVYVDWVICLYSLGEG